MTTEDLAGGPARASGRAQAIERRIDPARARAEKRVQRFLTAALELMNESASGADFTVQEVVERSGQSLRSFYQYFGGKQELLLALFEEAVLSTTEQLRAAVAEEGTALERLHRFVVDYYRICRPSRRRRKGGPNPAMTEFAQQLLTVEPAKAARAFRPLVELFEQLLAEASDEGAVRDNLPRRRVAGVVLEAIMFHAFSRTIVGAANADDGDPAEELFEFVLHGIATR
ncbi:MAG: TetR/AcrR family transcriptional regulator [Mycobacteriales bacterium]